MSTGKYALTIGLFLQTLRTNNYRPNERQQTDWLCNAQVASRVHGKLMMFLQGQ